MARRISKTWLLIIILTVFSLSIATAQELNAAMGREARLKVVKKWEAQIDSARKVGDIVTEITLLPRVIDNRMWDYGDYSGAYEMAVHLEELVTKNPDFEVVRQVEARLNSSLGELLKQQQRYKESLEYLEKAVTYSRRDSIFYIYRDASTGVGELYSLIGANDQAVIYFKKCEKEGLPFRCDDRFYCLEEEYYNQLYRFIAEHHFRNNELDSTIFYSKKAISFHTNTPSQLASEHVLLAKAYLITKDVDLVIYHGNEALNLMLRFGMLREEIDAHEVLHRAYKERDDFEKAYYHFEKFFELHQEQRSFDDALQIGKLNTKREQEFARQEKVLSDNQLSNQRSIIWVVSGGLVLLIAGLFFIYTRLKIIRKQNKIIAQEKERAEQSERYKEQFLANMSHEIRTPMHAISGMLNSMRRQKHPKNQKHYLDAMKVSADNLLVLLNDVLDLSKVESGNLDIVQEAIDVPKIVHNTIHLFQYKAEEKGLLLKTTIPKDFPKQVVGDTARLQQILVNLVDNALKFTEKGSIEIRLDQAGNFIQFEVKDTGLGISETQQNLIFESFKQGDNISKGSIGGTGLGLAISKQLIELQNGKIWVESEEEKGTSFHFQLPLQLPKNKKTTTNQILAENELLAIGKEMKGVKILLAEDNRFNIMVAQDDLQWFIPEVDITIVKNGVEALSAFKEKAFDMILMDVQMPEMNGYEATRAIRELEVLKNIDKRTPIVAMTASLLKEQINKCYDAGMDGYIPKPYQLQELVLGLANAIDKMKTSKEMSHN
ncbi:ATP-binding protein [Flagellimonas eckloniae]|uniref:tetratricopeptide repeat-containing hybrid sensor histidine kinase/response regulator n=1 Tax=Flagellimonas eckloniae TaxID=346185 RepID=UPI0006DCDE53|nr:ATP-binding protein [Allomuricauda eckloniae]